MILVISEKPSVAQSIAAVLGAKQRGNGYLEGNGYLVSWCLGHLVELASADAYDPKYKRWNTKDLPIVPENWKYAVPSDKAKQLKILSGLMADKRVDSLVCATDAGREGELIFRLVTEHCGCKKPVQRLWISSMEDSAIREGFQNLKSDSEYDRLYAAALCRARADWIVGINATRLFSVLYRTTLNVGRVQSPTLAMLVQREAEIAAFRKTPFYTVELNCGSFKGTGEKLDDRQAAEAIRMACDGKAASVKAVIRQEKSAQPPKLYDLTTLQRDANRILGYTAQQTLDYTQSLYEKKLVTYPRTDSRYLTDDMRDTVPELVKTVSAAFPFAENPPVHAERVIDSSKVSDHHAIIPTRTLAGADLSGLPTGEASILILIAARLLCAVGNPCVTAETTVTLECSGHAFTSKGKTVTDSGWKGTGRRFLSALKKKTDKKSETVLPGLAEGRTFANVRAFVREGFTSPPKHYTEDTLLAAMENAGAEEFAEIPDAGNGVPAQAQRSGLCGEKEGQRNGADLRRKAETAEYSSSRRGLGTPATRAGIIEKIVKTGFVERKGRQLLPTQKGVSLIGILPEPIKSPALTAEWETKLQQVEHGDLPASAFMDGIRKLTEGLIKDASAPKSGRNPFRSDREPVGVCPRCGRPVYEGKKSFYCSGYRESPPCGFALWKDDRFFTSKKKALTKETAAALLKEGRADMSGLYSRKTGKTYDATVVLNDTGGKYVNFRLEFSAPNRKKHSHSENRRGNEQ